MNFYLVGYRGTGKTTVARALAARIGWLWADVDDEVQRRERRSIASIFEQDGEAAFRDLEAVVLTDLASQDARVVSVGGGAILREESRRCLRQTGHVVWLQAEPGTIQRRISQDPATERQRPNLTSHGGLAEIEQVLAQRRALYQAVAHQLVDTEGKTPEEVVSEICRAIRVDDRSAD